MYYSDVLLWVALLCITIYAWPKVQRTIQLLEALNKIPGPSFIQMIKLGLQYPFNGEVNELNDYMKGAIARHAKQNSLFAFKVGTFLTVMICKAEAVKGLFSSKTLLEKGSEIKYIKMMTGDSVFSCQMSKWHQRRKLISPTFHVQVLEKFLVVMNEQSELLVNILDEKNRQINGKEFDICPFISRCGLDINCETAMGQGVNSQLNNDNEYIDIANSVLMLVSSRCLKPWLLIDWIYRRSSLGQRTHQAMKISNKIINDLIKKKRNELAESKTVNGPHYRMSDDAFGKKHRLAFLEMLLEYSTEGKGDRQLTDRDIEEEVGVFMVAGFHTSSVAMSWALHYIGANPDVQQKISDELDLVFGSNRDRHSTSSDLHELNYLECVIKETLRLNPPAPRIGILLTEVTNICGYTIPAGTDISIWIYWVHRDPAYYPDPDTFNPDRFLPENSKGRDPYAFIPFSAGPRNCIGHRFAMMEMKVVLAAILKRFKVTTMDPALPPKIATNLLFAQLPENRVQLKLRNCENP